MALKLPTNFKNDLESRNLNLVPIVTIGNMDYVGETLSFTSDFFDISTGVINIGNNRVTKPLLLNMPSLNESIDIEKRKYKINNVTLDISNYEQGGGDRFSEMVGSDPLINKECRIYWKSPSTELPEPIDLTKEYTSNNVFFQVYFGIIRRYTHTDEKVRIELEDRSQLLLQTKIPLNDVEGDSVPEKYKNKPYPLVFGRVQKSPMVISLGDEVDLGEGESQLTELQLSATDSDNYGEGFQITSDTSQNFDYQGGNFKYSPLYFYENDYYYNAAQYQDTVPDSNVIDTTTSATFYNTNGKRNFIDDENKILFDISGQGDATQDNNLTSIDNDSSGGLLRVFVRRKLTRGNSFHEKWYGSQYTDVVNQINPNPSGLIDGKVRVREYGDNTSFEQWTVGGYRYVLDSVSDPSDILEDKKYGGIEQKRPIDTWLFLNVEHENFSTETSVGDLIDAINIDSLKTNWGVWCGDWQSVRARVATEGNGTPLNKLGFINEGGIVFNESVNSITGSNAIYAFQGNETSNGVIVRLFDSLGSHDFIRVGIPRNEITNLPDINDIDFHIHTKINKIELIHKLFVTGLLNKEYYCDVVSRNIEYADGLTTNQHTPFYHMIELTRNVLKSDKVTGDIPIKDSLNDYQIRFSDGTSSSNPYRTNFTVYKKVEAKKVLEELASVSPLIPKFNNQGDFSVDFIHKEYNAEPNTEHNLNGYDHIVKNVDVIDFSYNRTNPEHIYSKVKLKWGLDYGADELKQITEEFLGTSELAGKFHYGSYLSNMEIDDYNLSYYGLKEDHSESTLEIDDHRGRYITDEHSARAFAQLMLSFHCNMHLKMKVKLPLNYIDIEVGDIVIFDELLGNGLKPYGIDYSRFHFLEAEGNYAIAGDVVNGQQVFPNMMVLKTNKRMDFIEIECIQMHNLNVHLQPTQPSETFGCTYAGIQGESHTIPPEYDEDATVDNGSCSWYNVAFGCADPDDPNYMPNEYIVGSYVEESGNFTLDGIPFVEDSDLCASQQVMENPMIARNWDIDNSSSNQEINFTDPYQIISNKLSEVQENLGYIIFTTPKIHLQANHDVDEIKIKFKNVIISNAENITATINHPYGITGTDSGTIFTFSVPADAIQIEGEGLGDATVYNEMIVEIECEIIYTQLGVESSFIDTIKIEYSTSVILGDMNSDGGFNVLDIVTLANCVLANNCEEVGDINQDGGYNVLDIITLSNCVMNNNCGDLS